MVDLRARLCTLVPNPYPFLYFPKYRPLIESFHRFSVAQSGKYIVIFVLIKTMNMKALKYENIYMWWPSICTWTRTWKMKVNKKSPQVFTFFTAQWALTADGILTEQLPKGLWNSLDKNKPFSLEISIRVYVTKKIWKSKKCGLNCNFSTIPLSTLSATKARIHGEYVGSLE
jgi:hypothetical protein